MNTRQEWKLINEYGNGCKTYVDIKNVEHNGNFKKVWVRYYLDPPGKDLRNGREAREIFMLEEYDCENKKFRILRMFFVYADASKSELLESSHDWAPASAGNEITLNFLLSN